MNAQQLERRLLAEGCSPLNFSIRSTGAGDLHCLDEHNGKWTVFYTERGINFDPIYESSSEEDACRFYYDFIMKIDHWHLVGFFEDESSALELEAKLTSIDVASIRNDIPAYQHANDPRFRVFVVGSDIFKVRDKLGDIIQEST